jgi:hypothetical protein
MRRLLKLAIPVFLLLLLAGHYLYWYGARERPATPEPGSWPARLLTSGTYGACLWLPYPHQNLAKLEGAIGDGPAYLAAVADVADLPAPVLPSFGPFAVPPSHEIVACSDLGGDRFLLVARVYPGLAWVARMAGKIADNPWLSGGEIRETRGHPDAVEERVLRIAWIDGYWTVRAGAEAQIPASPPSSPPPPQLPESLGILHLAKDVSDFPAGSYVLQRKEKDFEIALAEGGEIPEAPAAVAGASPPVMLAVAGPIWPADAEKPLPPAAMVLFGGKSALHLGPLGDLPGLAVLNPPGEKRWGLPARGLAGLITDSLPHGNASGWSVVALDDASFTRATALAPQISELVPPDGGNGEEGDEARMILGLWLQPRPALSLIHEIRRKLEKIPLVGHRQVERWHDWETLLGPLGSCERASLAATQSPAAFQMRLQRCG